MGFKKATDEIRMTPIEVAEILHLSTEVVSRWLVNGCPFGNAVPNGNGYKYIIVRKRFELYMSGADLTMASRGV